MDAGGAEDFLGAAYQGRNDCQDRSFGKAIPSDPLLHRDMGVGIVRPILIHWHGDRFECDSIDSDTTGRGSRRSALAISGIRPVIVIEPIDHPATKEAGDHDQGGSNQQYAAKRPSPT